MNIIIAGGTGFIGQFMVNRYLKQNHMITIIGRSLAKIKQIYKDQVEAIDWNSFNQHGKELLSDKDLIINLTGAGIANQRWTGKRKKELLESRLIPTKTIAEFCAQLNSASPPLFNASAVSVYGGQTENGPEFLEISSLPNEHHFSSDLVKQWEETSAVAANHHVRVVNMRFGVVLGPGGVLKRLKLPFLLGFGGKIGTGQQYFPWISILDLCRALDFLLPLAQVNGPVNFVSPESITQQQFAKALGKALKRPTLLPTPAYAVKLLFGEMGDDLLLNGQNVKPQVLEDQGFSFQYKHVSDALHYALKGNAS